MKTATALFDLSMNVECPHCEESMDLEEMYSGDSTWLDYFGAWFTGKTEIVDKIEREEECPSCEKTFLINKIER